MLKKTNWSDSLTCPIYVSFMIMYSLLQAASVEDICLTTIASLGGDKLDLVTISQADYGAESLVCRHIADNWNNLARCFNHDDVIALLFQHKLLSDKLQQRIQQSAGGSIDKCELLLRYIGWISAKAPNEVFEKLLTVLHRGGQRNLVDVLQGISTYGCYKLIGFK